MSGRSLIRADLLLALESAGAVSTTELRLPDDLELGKLEALGAMLGQLHSACRWWQGDFLAYIEAHHPAFESQLSEALGLSPDGRSEYLRVALAIPPPRRRPALSWSHHRRVAARWITPEQRERLLDIAEDERLASNELLAYVEHLREEVEALEAGGEDETEDVLAPGGDGTRSRPASTDCADLVDEIAAELRDDLLACGFPFERLSIRVESGAADLVATVERVAA